MVQAARGAGAAEARSAAGPWAYRGAKLWAASWAGGTVRSVMIAATGAGVALVSPAAIVSSVEPDGALAPAVAAVRGRYDALYLALRPILWPPRRMVHPAGWFCRVPTVEVAPLSWAWPPTQ